MMNVTHKKDGSKSYMIIALPCFDENDYRFQMIINNQIKNLLPVKVKTVNSQNEIYYDTTSMISLKEVYEKKQMGSSEFIELIKRLKMLADSLREYLLDMDYILLEPECIFVERQSGIYYFCYYPVEEEELQDNLRRLFDRLLEYVNHNDRTAVEIAYGIEQRTISDSFSIQELLDFAVQKAGEEKKQKEIHDIKEENVFVVPEPETGFIKQFLNLFKRKKYQSEEELDEEFYTEKNLEQEEDFEDATVFLAPNGKTYSITLKSVNPEIPIAITPTVYPCILGKSKKSSDYVIESPVISRVHMRISVENDNFYIEDLNSTNGTYINGSIIPAHEPREIKSGDEIRLANLEFILE